MKKLLSIVAAILMTFGASTAFVGCDDEPDTPGDVLEERGDEIEERTDEIEEEEE